MNVIRWLLDSDPSIRWQAMRDLTDESDEGVAAERSRVASEGWGAALLAFQADDGHFVVGGKRGWSTDLHALVLLKDMGLDPASAQARSAVERVREHLIWEVCDDNPFFDGETEPCINGASSHSGHISGKAAPRSLIASSESSSKTAAGTAKLHRARDPRSIVRSAFLKGYCNTRRVMVRPRR